MPSKSTVAIDPLLRKKIKRLAAQLDVSQGEIIKYAIADFEKNLEKTLNSASIIDSQLENARQEMKKYTALVWQESPEIKDIQQKMLTCFQENNLSIDLEDVIIKKWKTGLEE